MIDQLPLGDHRNDRLDRDCVMSEKSSTRRVDGVARMADCTFQMVGRVRSSTCGRLAGDRTGVPKSCLRFRGCTFPTTATPVPIAMRTAALTARKLLIVRSLHHLLRLHRPLTPTMFRSKRPRPPIWACSSGPGTDIAWGSRFDEGEPGPHGEQDPYRVLVAVSRLEAQRSDAGPFSRQRPRDRQ